ncbi:transcriptional repressor LexA [Candidatus Uhrbacteria bacterium]|jgi:DNA (cytosine-5)-methyltransferase 1|nr:transcriptional repressor LexA [Candidatus Uhrbacteria bacterium]MBT7716800.1 transcriptional repressor LexA [Candidatus Uhrbacteria bacterium]
MVNERLTNRQSEILEFIKSGIEEDGIPPTINQLRGLVGLKSNSTIHQHVQALVKKGYIEGSNHIPRSISLKVDTNTILIPVKGSIAAGKPIEVLEDETDLIEVPSSLLSGREDCYALRVKGDSMIDDGIFDGDIVIIKPQISPENGQTVVAILEDDTCTLKKIYRLKDGYRLQPANQNILPIFVKELEVRGVVIRVIRNFSKDKNNKDSMEVTNSFKTVDLFAGVGGVRLGFEAEGFETVFANDYEPKCKDTYDLNFRTSKLVVEDIRNIHENDLPDFDILLGGFPCQAFSIAGYRQGFDDKKERGNLFFDVARILETRKPKAFLLENVKNLQGHDQGKTFKIIKETLQSLGYSVSSKVLNTMDYGNVPQNRERIYIVGFLNADHLNNFSFPDPVELKVKITDILESKVDDKYYYNGKPLYEKIKDDVKEFGKVYQWRRKYVRENKKGVCPTLTANMGTGGHNVPIIKDENGIRKLTPRECARIQGFPDSYIIPEHLADSALYKQFGNSVSVPVLRAIAKKMKFALNS